MHSVASKWMQTVSVSCKCGSAMTYYWPLLLIMRSPLISGCSFLFKWDYIVLSAFCTEWFQILFLKVYCVRLSPLILHICVVNIVLITPNILTVSSQHPTYLFVYIVYAYSVFYVLVNMLLISVIFRFKAVVMEESQGSAEQVGAYTT